MHVDGFCTHTLIYFPMGSVAVPAVRAVTAKDGLVADGLVAAGVGVGDLEEC